MAAWVTAAQCDRRRDVHGCVTGSMIILWSLLLTAAATAHKVMESTEDIGPEAFANVTTLYPVANQQTNNITHNENNNNEIITKNKNITDIKDKPKIEATSWKIEAAFAESNLDKDNATTVAPEVELKNETKVFRPSQHLGSFLDDEVAPTKETYDSFTPVIKKPASGFVSSKEEYRYNNNIPKELLRTHKEYPYKFESSIYTKDSWRPDRHKPWPQGTPGLAGIGDRPGKEWGIGNSGFDTLERPVKGWGQGNSGLDSLGQKPGNGWGANSGFDGFRDRPKDWSPDSLEPKPTVEAPVKLPAGGLYKYTDPFKDKPGNNDETFGLEFNNDVKEPAVMKRGNPWKGVLRMLTAFIPVGLIISALTPSIITIENVGPGNTYPSNIYRRTDTSELPAISERCRRRLLCELHNKKNYSTALNFPPHPRQWKQCYRIRCEDPAALTTTLRWLLDQQTNRQYT